MVHSERIGDCTLYLGNCLEVMPLLGRVGHTISDPTYEQIMHQAKASASARKLRIDGGAQIKPLDFDGIDAIRTPFTAQAASITDGWFIAFCSPEGVARWADDINPSPMKYKRACVWVKPDCAPQMNGQGPAMGAENFVCAWAGKGFARWNAGGKRGVYTHLVNPPDRDGRHPTEKPWRLMAEILVDFTGPDDVVLDPFMGSGSTLVAAAKLGRKAIGIELNPAYFDVACERVARAYQKADWIADVPDRFGQDQGVLFTDQGVGPTDARSGTARSKATRKDQSGSADGGHP